MIEKREGRGTYGTPTTTYTHIHIHKHVYENTHTYTHMKTHTYTHIHTYTHTHTISLPFFSKLLYVAPCFGHAVELLVHDRRTDVATPSPLEQLGGLGLDPLQGTLLEGYLLLDLLGEGEGEGSGRVMT